jgi:hypothetical protein
MRKLVAVCSVVLLVSICGCAHYTTPGGGISIPAITDANVAESLAREPTARFPAHIVVARVQASNYQSSSGNGYGSGRYSVLTTRDIETEADFMRLASMPGVAGVGALNRLLLPVNMKSTQELREAAAQLRGDMVLLYTIDTQFHTESKMVAPLQVVTLGIFASEKSRIVTTCSAAFIDVRTGFVYGLAEGSAIDTRRSTVWGTEAALDAARLKTEREAFAAALKEIEKVWTGIKAEHDVTVASVAGGPP